MLITQVCADWIHLFWIFLNPSVSTARIEVEPHHCCHIHYLGHIMGNLTPPFQCPLQVLGVNKSKSTSARKVGLVLLGAMCFLKCLDVMATEGRAIQGEKTYEARCAGCHSVSADRVGPRHAGVFGRRVGQVSGYAYSAALRSSHIVWTAENLDKWLMNPEALIPGQRMGYGLSDAQDRADIIAYLATLKMSEEPKANHSHP